MKGAFPGMNAWLWLVLTLIVCAIAIFWATSRIDLVDFPNLFGGKSEPVCQRPDKPPDFSSVRTVAYIDSESIGKDKNREVHRTLAIGTTPGSGFLKMGDRIYVDYGERNAWSGCYKIEEERHGIISRQIGIFVGSEQKDLERAAQEMGGYARADVWLV